MVKEILRIKFIENGKMIRQYSVNFRNWRRLHKKGGGSPFVIQVTDKSEIEITLRNEVADAVIEERKAKEWAK